MIIKAGGPGGGYSIALRMVEACDSPSRGELGCVIFGSEELRSRRPSTNKMRNTVYILNLNAFAYSLCSVCISY